MPIYEYRCPKCGTELEVIHGMSESPKVKCTGCRAAMKRMISTNSFQLKGDGWFKTSGSYAKGGAAKTGADNNAGAATAGTAKTGADTAGAATISAATTGAVKAVGEKSGGGKAGGNKKSDS